MPDRNTEMHFSKIPALDIQRSKFKENSTHTFSMNAGDLIPFYANEVLPGDTYEMAQSSIIRMLTPICPVMDNAYADVYYFFVPRRIVWDHWEEFMGENKTTYWENPVVYNIPHIKTGAATYWRKGDIANYLTGARIGLVSHPGIDACYFRAYAKIWNEWFRNQNVEEPAAVSTSTSTDTTITNMTTELDDPIVGAELGGVPLKVSKFADYFTSCLPDSQKGDDVYLPLGNTAPVITGDKNTKIEYPAEPLYWAKRSDGTVTWANTLNMATQGTNSDAGATVNQETTGTGTPTTIIPTNLWADLSQAQAATVNQLRQAFAIQRLLERDARGGTRYRELIHSHFSVLTDDARMQVPEYLGGKRIPINMTEVIQTSESGTTPQGNTGAMSKTIDSDYMFKKSFTEHGMIIGVMCIRTDHTYAQGINRMFTRKDRLDFYWPTLANLGETYVKNKEIFATGTSTDEEAFGYQERWAEYRYMPNRVSGEFSPDYATPLDTWTYVDEYSTTPTLSAEWMHETRNNIDRTLAIQNQDQFTCNIYFKATLTRPLPMYSIPGLIDHH